jgi:hypothetical protein
MKIPNPTKSVDGLIEAWLISVLSIHRRSNICVFFLGAEYVVGQGDWGQVLHALGQIVGDYLGRYTALLALDSSHRL